MAERNIGGRKVRKLCEECGEYNYMLLDRKEMLIRYIRPCSCVKRILEMRKESQEKWVNRKVKMGNILQKRI